MQELADTEPGTTCATLVGHNESWLCLSASLLACEGVSVLFPRRPPHGSLFSFTSKRLGSQVFFDSLPRSSFGFEVLLFDVNVGNILNLKLPLSLSLSQFDVSSQTLARLLLAISIICKEFHWTSIICKYMNLSFNYL
jgi:hypothetical protein